ncbi:conserved hypothetical protein [Histoplasma mississippiense (nom. inval.)]|uniref:conserved hypothetical protein n=1 Tax=Ajellomyces capsulatus (strain NAm1 / WU24) TaxID=2059318 RepID=UPI000157B4B0|nr:conserved hypothetical protein [Histoplasma mississippiense (nom. inval.)]EDN02354.1 conserved hypothetical protein [Histoplasma mississippiense (nom. inval.)]
MGGSTPIIRGLLMTLATFYGIYTFFRYGVIAIWAGTFFRRPTEKERLELLLAKDRLWNLSKRWDGFSHHFITLRDGFKFHYVANGPISEDLSSPRPGSTQTETRKPLVVFVHGFPDSWAIWRHILPSSLLWEHSTVVAVDLPGYGGTDSLATYSATEVMEHLAEFLIAIRRKYGIDSDDDYEEVRAADEKRQAGKVIYVGHDWGAVLGFRLASDAPQLADRFILTNGPLIPMPMVRYVGKGGNYSFLKKLHVLAAGKVIEFTVRDAEESMASTLGPGGAEFKTTTADGDKYPASVWRRIERGNFGDMASYYRHGAAVGTWHKSLEVISALYGLGEPRRTSTGMVMQEGPIGALHANATILWGEQDIALDPHVGLEGIADYLVHGSQVVMLPRTAHFPPVEIEGRVAIEKAVEWAVGGEKGDVGAVVAEVYPGAVVTVRK